MAAVLVVAILGAGDQQVIREPGAHSWPSYPVGYGGYYLDYAGAAAFVARRAQPGDGAVYPGREHQQRWMMIGYGLQYYLSRDMPNGVPRRISSSSRGPRPRRAPSTRSRAGSPPPAWAPSRGSGSVGSGRQLSPYQAVTPAQASLLRPRYRLSLVKHVRGLTVFLLTRAP